jgi:hypothetical protein
VAVARANTANTVDIVDRNIAPGISTKAQAGPHARRPVQLAEKITFGEHAAAISETT